MCKHISRRKFVKNLGLGCAALGGTTLLSSILNLNMLNAASVVHPPPLGDYKALVCILLAGGNDSFNMLIPRGNTEYAEYQTVRSNLAIPQGDILAINANTTDGKQYGVHPSMPEVQQLFNNGNLGFVANVGTLIERVNDRNEFYNSIKRLPLGLYSHADQIEQWQTSVPHDRSGVGWGGRMADVLNSMNTTQNVSMSISMSGTNVFQAGNQTISFNVDPGAEQVEGILGYNNTEDGFDMIRTNAINSLLAQQYANIFEDTYSKMIRNSQDASDFFAAALSGITPLTTTFSANGVSASMKRVAEVIAARNALGMCRQTFFITFGGWDHHDEVLNAQTGMLAIVSKALQEFYDATIELGVQNEVTTFTISDFARTLTSNGNGTDHAWGGNTMVMGGSVNGGSIYGTYPDLYLTQDGVITNPLDLGRGVFIPTTSADEYFAELALWFGVSTSDLDTVLPNIRNFYVPSVTNAPIGFMQM